MFFQEQDGGTYIHACNCKKSAFEALLCPRTAEALQFQLVPQRIKLSRGQFKPLMGQQDREFSRANF